MKKILVALDGSARSTSVLHTAIDLAQKVGARLLLFRSYGVPPEMPDRVWNLPGGSLEEALRKDTESYLEGCDNKLPDTLRGGIRVGVGSPWQAICSAAHDERADLVVIGSHGYGGIDRLLGTTAAKVVNHIDRSVLVVRTHADRPG